MPIWIFARESGAEKSYILDLKMMEQSPTSLMSMDITGTEVEDC